MGQLNILFITVDQWPGHLLGCAGHPVIETPTLDQLARLGNALSQHLLGMPDLHPGAPAR